LEILDKRFKTEYISKTKKISNQMYIFERAKSAIKLAYNMPLLDEKW